MDKDIEEIDGACHCGSVTFRVRLLDGLHTARRCNCSYCRMRGAVAVSARVGELRVLTGADVLTLYRFNTMEAKHWFCSKCGIYTHHQRRRYTDEYGVNLACLAGLSPFDVDEVPVRQGPVDDPDPAARALPAVAGWLRYVRNQNNLP